MPGPPAPRAGSAGKIQSRKPSPATHAKRQIAPPSGEETAETLTGLRTGTAKKTQGGTPRSNSKGGVAAGKRTQGRDTVAPTGSAKKAVAATTGGNAAGATSVQLAQHAGVPLAHVHVSDTVHARKGSGGGPPDGTQASALIYSADTAPGGIPTVADARMAREAASEARAAMLSGAAGSTSEQAALAPPGVLPSSHDRVGFEDIPHSRFAAPGLRRVEGGGREAQAAAVIYGCPTAPASGPSSPPKYPLPPPRTGGGGSSSRADIYARAEEIQAAAAAHRGGGGGGAAAGATTDFTDAKYLRDLEPSSGHSSQASSGEAASVIYGRAPPGGHDSEAPSSSKRMFGPADDPRDTTAAGHRSEQIQAARAIGALSIDEEPRLGALGGPAGGYSGAGRCSEAMGGGGVRPVAAIMEADVSAPYESAEWAGARSDASAHGMPGQRKWEAGGDLVGLRSISDISDQVYESEARFPSAG
jgi:hypothetical protein